MQQSVVTSTHLAVAVVEEANVPIITRHQQALIFMVEIDARDSAHLGRACAEGEHVASRAHTKELDLILLIRHCDEIFAGTHSSCNVVVMGFYQRCTLFHVHLRTATA
jgi:hypothetical protein